MELRPATWEDRETLYRWRLHDEETSRWWQGVRVTQESHNTWLKERLGCPAVQIWIAQDTVNPLDSRLNPIPGKRKTYPVGWARVDSNGELAVSREHSEKIIRQVCKLTNQHRLKACLDRADPRLDTFLKAGFVLRDDVAFLRHDL